MSSSPKIMGILNITPDSFYDGGRYWGDVAIAHAITMSKQGADWIDVGGESTRPGAAFISEDEECDRVIPIIERLTQEIATPISIDSRRAKVIRAAIAAGATLVNDVQALTDPLVLECISKAPKFVQVCLMHMQGNPTTMQQQPQYSNVIQDIFTFLKNRIESCERAGIEKERIWIDPGFGFGKTLDHNLILLANLSYFKTLGCRLCVGLSRKSMFKDLLDRAVENRLSGSLTAALIAVMQGASMIRTHDVEETKDALSVFCAVQERSFHAA